MHLYPVFAVGETVLNLDVATESYGTGWTSDTPADKRRALLALADLINADTGTTGIRAEVFLETLILIHTSVATAISYDAELAGHTWEVTAI